MLGVGRWSAGAVGQDPLKGSHAGRPRAGSDRHHSSQPRIALRAPRALRELGHELGDRRDEVGAPKPCLYDEHVGARVLEHVVQVPRFHERVERRHPCAEPHGADGGAEPFPAVRAQQADRAAAPDPERVQPGGERVDPLVQFGCAQRHAGADHRGCGGGVLRQLSDELREMTAARPRPGHHRRRKKRSVIRPTRVSRKAISTSLPIRSSATAAASLLRSTPSTKPGSDVSAPCGFT